MAINKQLIIQPKVAKNHLAKFVKNLEDEGVKYVYVDPKVITDKKDFSFISEDIISSIQSKIHGDGYKTNTFK